MHCMTMINMCWNKRKEGVKVSNAIRLDMHNVPQCSVGNTAPGRDRPFTSEACGARSDSERLHMSAFEMDGCFKYP
jgi:hypothetical protein